MKKKYGFLFLIILMLLIFAYWGTRSEVDPEWAGMEEKLYAKYLTLAAANDFATFLYISIHDMSDD